MQHAIEDAADLGRGSSEVSEPFALNDFILEVGYIEHLHDEHITCNQSTQVQ